MRTSVATLFAALAVAGCVDSDSSDPSTTAEPVVSTTLRVADWNLQVNGQGTDGSTNLERTYQTLRAQAADADIITCNECYASTINSFRSRLTADTGVPWYAVTAFDIGTHNHSGVWSRYPFTSTPVVHQYSQPAAMDTGPKSAGEVDVDVDGTTLHLIVTRLCSPCGGGVRAVQAQELVAWADGFGEPRLITGDFNDNPSAASITTMKADYVDVYRRAQADGHTTAYANNPNGLTHGCSIIDYLWLSNGADELSVLDAEVPDLRAPPLANPNPVVTEKVGCTDDYGIRPSDHNMVEAGFTLTGSAPPPPPSALPPGWIAADVGAVGQSGATSFAGGTFALDAGGTSVWSTADAFHYLYQPWTGDGVIIARVDAIAANGGSDAGAGVMFRDSVTAAGAREAAMLVFASGKAKFRDRPTPGADINTSCCSAGPSAGSGPPRWVKLVRTGDHFAGYTSTTGTSWGTPIASADVAMGATIWVGVAGFREGNFAGTRGHITVSNVALASPGLTSPWRTRDVGAVDVAGATAFATGAYTIDAGGTWIWSTADAFRFVYQPWRGDGTLIARVDSLTGGGGTDAAAGVMLRSDLTAGSPLASMLVFGSGKAKFRHRATAAADLNSTCCSTGPSTGNAPVRWVKLVRTGNHFAGYVSSTGTSWTSIGATDMALPSELYAGVAAVREGAAGTARVRAVVSAATITP